MPPMVSRPITAFLLSIALLLGQLGGIAHAASHYQEDGKGRPHSVCELCVAYAALDAGATSDPPAFHGESCGFAQEAEPAQSHGSVTLPPYASRATPVHV